MTPLKTGLIIFACASAFTVLLGLTYCTHEYITNTINCYRAEDALHKFFRENFGPLRKLFKFRHFPGTDASNYWKFHEIAKTNAFRMLSEGQILTLISKLSSFADFDAKEFNCIVTYIDNYTDTDLSDDAKFKLNKIAKQFV